jgi:hypothetical protein
LSDSTGSPTGAVMALACPRYGFLSSAFKQQQSQRFGIY